MSNLDTFSCARGTLRSHSPRAHLYIITDIRVQVQCADVHHLFANVCRRATLVPAHTTALVLTHASRDPCSLSPSRRT